MNLFEPYIDKFYEVAPLIVDKRDKEFANIFISYLSPGFLARDVDVERFNKLLETADPEKDFYIKFLK